MLSILFWAVVFVASLAVLIKSADWFTEGAERLGISLGISEFVVGMTVVSVGTSLPELITGAIAAWEGHAQLVLDNVVGSNISNIFLILGVASIAARSLKVERNLIDLDLPILAASQAVLVFVLLDGKVSLAEALISFAVAVVYVLYTLRERRGQLLHKHKRERVWKLVGIIAVSALFIFVGAKFTVDSMLELGALLGVGASALAATALAVGTSLPELVVSVQAARKKKFEMAIGNIFGSNIFNSAGVVGLIGVFAPLTASAGIMSVGMLFLLAAVTLCVISGISKRIHSWEGAFFLALYALFVVQMFGVI